MVRLVFRPYTHVRRTICTSVSLRASTRVSPGFTLPRHSSPSFGSQQMCSAQTSLRRSWPVDGAHVPPDTFIPHTSLALAYSHMCMDSLVRVSRRVGTLHEPGLGDAQPSTRCNHEHSNITEDLSVPQLQRAFGKNPSRCLTPKHLMSGSIHASQKTHFPPHPHFQAPQSHQIGSYQFKSTTEVGRRTDISAVGASRFTLNGFTYFSLSFQSSFHLSLTVLVRYRSPANI